MEKFFYGEENAHLADGFGKKNHFKLQIKAMAILGLPHKSCCHITMKLVILNFYLSGGIQSIPNHKRHIYVT